jgi:hypothetical protein
MHLWHFVRQNWQKAVIKLQESVRVAESLSLVTLFNHYLTVLILLNL